LVLDPACIAACACYAINRWLIEPHVSASWIHSWVNDAFLIPAALPLLLVLQRLLGLRMHDGPPTWGEILIHLVGWSLLFEWIGPMLNRHSTGDVLDVVAYTIGAIAAGCWWNRARSSPPESQSMDL
jgi:integral membrane sensor domain MASE1